MIEQLKILGLTHNEAIVYSTLCKYKSLSGNNLARKCGIDRSMTYNLLTSLTNKGIVAFVVKNKIKHFFVTDPHNLLKEIRAKEGVAKNLISQIVSLKKKDENDQFVQVLEGPIGSRVFYSLTSQYKNETLYTFGGSGKMLDKHYYYLKHFSAVFQKNKTKIKMLAPKNYQLFDKLVSLFDVQAIQSVQPKQDASCSVVGEHIVFHTYEDNPKVICIKNKMLAAVIVNLFEDAWNRYPKDCIVNYTK